MKDLTPGTCIPAFGVLIRIIDLKEMCNRLDEECLEYDIDDLWNAFKERGAPWEVMMPSGMLAVFWTDDLTKKGEIIDNE